MSSIYFTPLSCLPLPKLLILLSSAFVVVHSCGYPGSPAHASVTFSSETIETGTVATYACDNGYELLGPPRRSCADNGTWVPSGVPFCVLNVAVGKAAMQSSTEGSGGPQKAVDGSTSTFFNPNTCSMTESERNAWWYVNLLEMYSVQLVRIDFGSSCCSNNRPATITVRVGSNRPDLGSNPICNKFTGFIEEGRPLFLPCARPLPGVFVSVHLESPGNSLSICEAFVYTDRALSIEQCPSFRDQPLGSTSTYSGKCYVFYNNQPMTFDNAKRFCDIRGGSLVDEISPALQGFFSWELYRRHQNDPNGQYWMGAVRDSRSPKNWKWINGKDVTISFWNQAGTGMENCSRFDGSRGGLWSDTNCKLNLNFVCQHRPLSCGKPERPANSSILARSVDIGSVIEYRCNGGNLLIGPNVRTCLANGFFSPDFSPKCKYLECGSPASITNGQYKLVNSTRSYLSGVEYSCKEGFVSVGRTYLTCDVDERWNGPPPRCEPILCPPPPPLEHGLLALSNNSTIVGTKTFYSCLPGFDLIGDSAISCNTAGYWEGQVPFCKVKSRPSTTTAFTTSTTAATVLSSSSTSTTTTSSTTSTTTTTPTPPTLPFSRVTVPQFRPAFPSTDGHSYPPYSTFDHTTSTHVPSRGTVGVTRNQPTKPATVVPSTRKPSSVVPSKKVTVSLLDRPFDNEIGDTSSVRQNSHGAKSGKLNMGGIIALGVFGGFVFLAAVVTIIIIIVRRLKNNQSSIDAQTISTFDSSGEQSGYYRNYQQAWENLRYAGHNATYKSGAPGISSRAESDFNQTHMGSRGFTEGFRDTNEITLNADVAALYSSRGDGNRSHRASNGNSQPWRKNY